MITYEFTAFYQFTDISVSAGNSSPSCSPVVDDFAVSRVCSVTAIQSPSASPSAYRRYINDDEDDDDEDDDDEDEDDHETSSVKIQTVAPVTVAKPSVFTIKPSISKSPVNYNANSSAVNFYSKSLLTALCLFAAALLANV